MKKILALIVLALILITAGYYTFIYYVPFSEGTRSGELIKFSNRGLIIKTWEGEISQGISGAQIFSFSVEQDKIDVIKDLQDFQGKYVKVSYLERYGSFFWLGDTNHFITSVALEKSPHSPTLRATVPK
ncbi:6-phosphogluconate dehydrogenase [Bizionia gelidisalsuginis]|uniref:6-phosphogluconate dehydrogenase n=1 Tax=Bizionia gelidisalsuginis TaxID=291188 RepID=A0ABY3MEV8_9FLAO|nr:6-phosphogluconate dehydrogenase [Bizionia gelidisalsuginis]TYC18130.1 6-phosphogluconate dehydrogenase [Bizionia gelidisalsuginis]